MSKINPEAYAKAKTNGYNFSEIDAALPLTYSAATSQAWGNTKGTIIDKKNVPNDSGTPFYKGVERIAKPLVPYTNKANESNISGLSTTKDEGYYTSEYDRDFNAHASITHEDGSTQLANSQTSIIRAHVSDIHRPRVTWDFSTVPGIKNLETQDDTFIMDYHLWISKTSEKDGHQKS